MVCKENVVSWFRNLSSYKRIDVMCTLLNMCLPFEVRYLGTCVEEIGKRDYNDLRDTEHHANNASDLAELPALGVTDKRTRRKLALYVALLHSCNYGCALILYKNLSNLDYQDIASLLNGTNCLGQDDQPLEELLLLYTMALNHPAFTYEQKTVFSNIYSKLQEEEVRINLTKPNAGYKPPQSCVPGLGNTEKLIDLEVPSSCLMPPPPMQTYHAGDMSLRSNSVMSGVPPGLAMPPPGLCLAGPEQMTLGSAGGGAQYVHVGFPSVNHHMPPWTGQVMMGNQAVYHAADVLAYPASPLVSRQSSPSQSRSPSRSNSPMGRRNNGRNSGNPASTATSSAAVSGQSSVVVSTTSAAGALPPLPGLGRNLQQSPLMQPRSQGPISTAIAFNQRHGSNENVGQGKQAPPPPRLRPTDSLRETLGKEMPNFKGNLQNFSLDEIRRMSDEDLREIGLTPNAMGQLRNIVKNQTSNGMNQIIGEKKSDSSSGGSEQIENEVPACVDVNDGGGNACLKQQLPPAEQQQQQHPGIHQQANHAPPTTTTSNFRRYPAVPALDPAQLQMYPAPQPMYTAQNAPCYACLTVPVAGMQNRYPRCNAQHMYCLGQLQAMRLDPDSSRHCSQSSSSDSTGSRSPPETPPAAPWVGGEGGGPPSTVSEQHGGSVSVHSTVSHPGPHGPQQQQQQQQQQPLQERQQRPRRNHQASLMRHKNQQLANGNGNNGAAGGASGPGAPPNLPHCVSLPAPPTHSPVTYHLPHAGHFPALRPSTGIYSSFSHGPYARPAYPTTAYQPNGEMMYQYPVNPASAGQSILPTSAGGTPPPTAPPVQSPYMPATPPTVVTYAPPAVPPPKISCCNCGSSGHLVADCKEQTMEDLTKKAQYRLDYSLMKQPGECPSNDK